MNQPAKTAKQKPNTSTPDLYRISDVRKRLSIGEWKLNILLSEGRFAVKDMRADGASKPSWRITRASYEKYLRSIPSVNSAEMFKRPITAPAVEKPPRGPGQNNAAKK